MDLLLVHSPLVGPSTWKFVADHLGHRAVVPWLTADHPPYYQGFAESAARALGSRGPVVLVGHSGAGPLLPAVAAVLGDRVRGAVFVDALLPHPGRSWFDSASGQQRAQVSELVQGDRLPPWNEWFPASALSTLVPDERLLARFVAELPSVPVAYFSEPAPDVPDVARCAYVRLSEAYAWAAEEAERLGWSVHHEPADHLAVLTQPARIADVVARAVSAVA